MYTLPREPYTDNFPEKFRALWEAGYPQEVLGNEIRRVFELLDLFEERPTIETRLTPQRILPDERRFHMHPLAWQALNPEASPEPPRLHQSANIEIIGKPRAGKSSLMASLRQAGIGGILIEEFAALTNDPLYQAFFEQLKTPQTYPVEMALFFTILKMKSTAMLSEMQMHDGIMNSLRQSHGQPEQFHPRVFVRGLNDALAFDLQLLKNFRLDDFYTDEVLDIIRAYMETMKYVDAVVLYDVTSGEAQNRRILDGMPADGWVVNAKYWPVLDYGYAWWREHVYPFLRREFGTGLLIVDGHRPLIENNADVLGYIKEIQSMKGGLVQLNHLA